MRVRLSAVRVYMQSSSVETDVRAQPGARQLFQKMNELGRVELYEYLILEPIERIPRVESFFVFQRIVIRVPVPAVVIRESPRQFLGNIRAEKVLYHYVRIGNVFRERGGVDLESVFVYETVHCVILPANAVVAEIGNNMEIIYDFLKTSPKDHRIHLTFHGPGKPILRWRDGILIRGAEDESVTHNGNAARINVAIVGATGAVGAIMRRVLEERDFPVARLYLLASSRSAGETLDFRGAAVVVADLEGFDFSGVQLAFFSAGASVSARHAPRAVAAGCVVVDNTSCFRYDDDVPLVVPEVNPGALARYDTRGIIANPNCSTIQMVVALKPLHDLFGVVRVNVATYQAVSGAGRRAVRDMLAQSRARLAERPLEPGVYPKPIAFNALPQIDVFLDNGYTKEEMKMVWETRKILGDKRIGVNPTTVRVPVVHGHSEAVHVEFARDVDVDAARAALAGAAGVTVVDERRDGGYPTAVTEAAGSDDVFVGRLRRDISHPRGLDLWIVSDNLRKGAATNSVQIAERLLREHPPPWRRARGDG